LVFEEYVSGRDENWGDDLGWVRFERDTLHDLRSSTKSIVGALVGIAINDGAISSVDASMVDLFPKRTIADAESQTSDTASPHVLYECGS
jgi:CubicO group peptidase (beta-lactamase class C family)